MGLQYFYRCSGLYNAPDNRRFYQWQFAHGNKDLATKQTAPFIIRLWNFEPLSDDDARL